MERVNALIIQSLAKYVSSRQKDWAVFLLAVLYTYNAIISEATGEASFFLIYGREPILFLDTNMLPAANLCQSFDFSRQRMMVQITNGQGDGKRTYLTSLG